MRLKTDRDGRLQRARVTWESSLQNIRVAKRLYNPPFSLAGVAGFWCVKYVSP